jgi:hypothetical protein
MRTAGPWNTAVVADLEARALVGTKCFKVVPQHESKHLSLYQ